jgi:hypothetical protein
MSTRARSNATSDAAPGTSLAAAVRSPVYSTSAGRSLSLWHTFKESAVILVETRHCEIFTIVE